MNQGTIERAAKAMYAVERIRNFSWPEWDDAVESTRRDWIDLAYAANRIVNIVPKLAGAAIEAAARAMYELERTRNFSGCAWDDVERSVQGEWIGRARIVLEAATQT
jgi:hypothetical protein